MTVIDATDVPVRKNHHRQRQRRTRVQGVYRRLRFVVATESSHRQRRSRESGHRDAAGRALLRTRDGRHRVPVGNGTALGSAAPLRHRVADHARMGLRARPRKVERSRGAIHAATGRWNTRRSRTPQLQPHGTRRCDDARGGLARLAAGALCWMHSGRPRIHSSVMSVLLLIGTRKGGFIATSDSCVQAGRSPGHFSRAAR